MGSGLNIYAEMNMYVVVSNYPYAGQATPFPEADPNPIYTSVWETGIPPEAGDHLGLVKRDEWRRKVKSVTF